MLDRSSGWIENHTGSALRAAPRSTFFAADSRSSSERYGATLSSPSAVRM